MSKTISGSRVAFKINGQKVAFASQISITEDDTLTDVDVLDQIDVAELAETAHKVNFSINYFKVDENAVEALGLRSANPDDLLRNSEFTCEVYDRITDQVVYTMTGCKFAGGNFTVAARDLLQGTLNFRARRGRGL